MRKIQFKYGYNWGQFKIGDSLPTGDDALEERPPGGTGIIEGNTNCMNEFYYRDRDDARRKLEEAGWSLARFREAPLKEKLVFGCPSFMLIFIELKKDKIKGVFFSDDLEEVAYVH